MQADPPILSAKYGLTDKISLSFLQRKFLPGNLEILVSEKHYSPIS